MSNEITQVMTRVDEERSAPFAIISDIHSNLTALQAVLADVAARRITRVVCLGDVVGYGPDPLECWRIIRDLCPIIIRGNHDQALGNREMARFHPRARNAIEWTRARLLENPDGQETIDAIANLPRSAKSGDRLYVHGSPAGPTMDYLLPGDAYDKPRMLKEFSLVEGYAFNGHTHIPGVVEKGGRFMPPEALEGERYELGKRQAIINVGSVGQPRDGNPKACYVTIEDGSVFYHRVAYDAAAVCERILAIRELDPFLGQRLLAGY